MIYNMIRALILLLFCSLPYALHAQEGVEQSDKTTLRLSAVFAGVPKPIRSGLTWRIFEDRSDAVAIMVMRADEPEPSFSLPQGSYMVHATYGFASTVKRVNIGPETVSERMILSAGALKLFGQVAGALIPPQKLSHSVYVPMSGNSEGRLVIAGIKGGELVRLPEGNYHVVSTYGDSNAIMRADLKVEPGQITEATLTHRAATVTLKLVAKQGGEAFAGTAFSVLTPGGDIIREVIGAFPTITLAEGEYTLIARHEGQVYTRDFKVETGLDRDTEIVAGVSK
jgi:hypothetical protein